VDTFQAAATFLDICQVWGELDVEIASKIKFAKYHAVRIAKAIKSGEDPNTSNPVSETEVIDQSLDSNDPDVKALQASDVPPPVRSKQPSVEEFPDDSDRIERRLAQQSVFDESLHPPRSSSVPPQISRVAASFPDSRITPGSVSQLSAPELPSAPADFAPISPASNFPGSTMTPSPEARPTVMTQNTFQSFPTPVSQPPSTSTIPPSNAYYGQQSQGMLAPRAGAGLPRGPAGAAKYPPVAPTAASNQTMDDQSILSAQKHARFAVSALTFDDVDTAIKELKTALRCLGSE
jgi:vacuolar protein sorting-associated protein VTA1